MKICLLAATLLGVVCSACAPGPDCIRAKPKPAESAKPSPTGTAPPGASDPGNGGVVDPIGGTTSGGTTSGPGGDQ